MDPENGCTREKRKKSWRICRCEREYADQYAIWTASVLWSITSKLVVNPSLLRQAAYFVTVTVTRGNQNSRKNSRFQRQSFLHSGENCVITLSCRAIQFSTGSQRYGYVWLLIIAAIENFKRLTSPSAVIDRQSEWRFANSFLTFNVDFRWKQSQLSRLSRSGFI